MVILSVLSSASRTVRRLSRLSCKILCLEAVVGHHSGWVWRGGIFSFRGGWGVFILLTAMESRAGLRQSAAMRSSYSEQIDLNLPPQLVQELTDSFKFFDRNGDGKISKEELGAVVRSLGQKVSDGELVKLMSDVDANGDGYIDLQEFIDLNTRAITECSSMDLDLDDYERGQSGSVEGMHDAMVSAFNVFDVDRNGLISAEELHSVLVGFGDEKVSLEDCRCMIQCVDEDGDQMVNFREFEALMSGTCVY